MIVNCVTASLMYYWSLPALAEQSSSEIKIVRDEYGMPHIYANDTWHLFYGYGYGYGIKTFNGDKAYIIDDIPTIIKHVHDNVAKGYILNDDFTLTETFVAKRNGKFAHGETLHEAFASLQEKLYDDSTEEERLEAFKKHFQDFTKKVSAKELFHWHHVLTGSCKQGRLSFCANKGIDIDNDTYTVHEFIELTQYSYGGDIIRKLK